MSFRPEALVTNCHDYATGIIHTNVNDSSTDCNFISILRYLIKAACPVCPLSIYSGESTEVFFLMVLYRKVIIKKKLSNCDSVYKWGSAHIAYGWFRCLSLIKICTKFNFSIFTNFKLLLISNGYFKD